MTWLENFMELLHVDLAAFSSHKEGFVMKEPCLVEQKTPPVLRAEALPYMHMFR